MAMHLRDYLDDQKLTFAEFGKKVGVSHATVSRWSAGKLLPTFGNLRKMQEITRGAITSASFGVHEGDIPPRRTGRAHKAAIPITESAARPDMAPSDSAEAA